MHQVILEDEKETIMEISLQQTVGQLKKKLEKYAGQTL